MNLHHWILALAMAAGLLGAGHIALTLLVYHSWTIDALWFLGTGFAFLIAAMANVATLTELPRHSKVLILTINLIMTGYFAVAWTVLPAPQVIVGGVVFLGLACTSLARQFSRIDSE